jgi:cephalosporin-C deacetylase-like acetyl esterase
MPDIRLPRPDTPDQFYEWTAKCMNERLDIGDQARLQSTAEGWPSERTERRAKLAQVLVPDWEVPDPQVTETGTIERELDGVAWTIHKLRFQSLPGYWITSLLYVPESARNTTDGSVPAVLLAIGHIETAKAFEEYHGLSEELCRQGMVVLAYDPPSQGERVMNWDWMRGQYDFNWGTTEHDIMGLKTLLAGWPLAQAWVWDGMRALDVLLAQPQVDSTRVGMCGVSGGGTQTAWMLAADDRLTAASPACFITSWREQFDAKLGADPEQHPYPIMAWGWDQADVLASFAPKPLQIVCLTDDFFPIEGTRNTFRKLDDLYTRLGAQGDVEIGETPNLAHSYHPPLRKATVEWMCKQFEIPFIGGIPHSDVVSPEELRVTPSGQLITSGFPRTLHDVIAETAPPPAEAPVAHERTETWQNGRRAALCELLSVYPSLEPVVVQPAFEQPDFVQDVGSDDIEGAVFERRLIETEPGIQVPVLHVKPTGECRGVMVHVNEFGADSDWQISGGPIYGALDAGWAVVSLDPRGVGAAASRVDDPDLLHRRFGTLQHAAWTWQMLDRPVIGQRVFDLLRVMEWARGLSYLADQPMACTGSGAGAVWAMLGAAIDTRVDQVIAIGPPVDFRTIVASGEVTWTLDALVPNVLKWGDLPDVAALIAPRSLSVVAPVDALRRAVTPETAHAAYRHAEEFAGQTDGEFNLIAAGERPEETVPQYSEWLA